MKDITDSVKNASIHPFKKEDLVSIIYPHCNQIPVAEQVALSDYSSIAPIIEKCGMEAFDFIQSQLDLPNNTSIILNTTSTFNISIFPQSKYSCLVNLKRINDIRYLNKFFETVNIQLPAGGTFIGCAETKGLRKKRILKKFPPVFNYIYYSLDFILKRVFPKLSFTRKIYFMLTNGRNRVLSRPEILGRLYSCGFTISAEKIIGNLYYFAVCKVKNPVYDFNPTYGPLIKLRRVGKSGKIINIYKFRTMHPYSEYIQGYIYDKNKIDSGGKFRDDFRITTIGKYLRKLWLDEIPMLINLFRGEVKLVGVRPLSQQYFSLYPENFRRIRIKFKPGLIPPFYKDMPKTFDEIIESERKYLEKYRHHPIFTDIRYFFAAMKNIIFKRARSK